MRMKIAVSICLLVIISFATSDLQAATTGSTGSGALFDNEQPSQALNYIIRISGAPDDLGEVGMFAGNFAPLEWAFADGRQLSRDGNPDLFDKIGDTFGGDGSTTFALPDLRGRTAIGTGQGPGLPNYTLGQTVGSSLVSMGTVPQHSHTIGSGYSTLNDMQGPSTHSNMQPSLALTPIIATIGTFPSRSLAASTDGDPAGFGTGSEPLLGELTWLAHDEVPTGWAVADGSLLEINENSALFSILGTQYGGNGRTNFALPDLRGRAPVGQGQGPGLTRRNEGDYFGAHEETLTATHLPNHTHSLTGLGGTTNGTGDGTPQSNLQPSVGLTYLIAENGRYPSRALEAATDSDDEIAAIGTGIDPYVASVSMFAGNFAPRAFQTTEGQLINISFNQVLFSLVGIEFGGDGRRTFGLPDLRGRIAVGASNSGSFPRIGDKSGDENGVLSTANITPHTHEFEVLAGDFDLDGDVDGSDFLVWQQGGSPDPLSAGDLSTWQTNYGASLSSPLGAASVPEPATSLLVLAAAVTLAAAHRRVGNDGC